MFEGKYISRKLRAGTEKTFFYIVVLSFKVEKFSLHLTKYVKRYSTELNHQPMMFICVLFGFNLTKAFQDFFTVKVDLKQFRENA